MSELLTLQTLAPALGILLGFTVQTAIGFAAGLVSLPIILIALPLPEAVATLSIFNLVFSVIQVAKNYRDVERETFMVLAPGTAFGVMAGALLLSFGSPTILKRALGIFIFVYIIHRYTNKKPIAVKDIHGYVLSSIGGFFAGLFSSGAPPFVVYMTSKYSEPKLIRANLIGILSITNFLRPIVLVSTGILNF